MDASEAATSQGGKLDSCPGLTPGTYSLSLDPTGGTVISEAWGTEVRLLEAGFNGTLPVSAPQSSADLLNFSLVFLFLFIATSVAYVSSQARGRIGAAGLPHSLQQCQFLNLLMRSEIELASLQKPCQVLNPLSHKGNSLSSLLVIINASVGHLYFCSPPSCISPLHLVPPSFCYVGDPPVPLGFIVSSLISFDLSWMH